MLLSAETIWGALRGELRFPQGIPALPASGLWGCLAVPLSFHRLLCYLSSAPLGVSVLRRGLCVFLQVWKRSASLLGETRMAQ